ncbi:MAG: hypothetical protein ACFE9I_14420 [Candidatus Hermodarchaeota archaeon]
MGETVSSGTFRKETTASKVVAFIAFLFMMMEAITLFYAVDAGADDIIILYGVLIIILAAVLFISLDFIDLKKFKIPYTWWILLVIGILLVIFAILAESTNYLPAALVLLAFLLEFLLKKKEYQASKLVALLGGAMGIYDCIIIFMSGDFIELFGMEYLYVNAVFGIIFAVILILTTQTKINIRIPFIWWIVAFVGFFFFAWIWLDAWTFAQLLDPQMALGGDSWFVLAVAFILLVMGF